MLLSAEKAAAGLVRVYRDATVVDGTGAPRYLADVAVEGARIAAVVPQVDERGLELPEGAVEVDAAGLVLAPGFIDLHAHSDLAVLQGAQHDAKIRQGVTTEVLGQDGLGYAPLDDATAAVIPLQIAGWNGLPATVPWRSMGDLLAEIDAAAVANAAVLVPQGNLRMMVVGHENRAATAAEIDAMAALLGEALDAGAFGMSSGLTYTPGMYADTAELEALCRVVAERGGYWAPHTRSYGGAALEAYAEAIEIGRRTGCPVHLTHATMNFAPNRGRAGELLALVDAALADGVDVTLDTYPYLPGATTLSALLPSRLAASGDLLSAIAALDAEGREAVRVELEEIGCDGFHGERADWSVIQISGTANPALSGLIGRTVAEIAAASGRRAVDVVLDTILADAGATGVLMHIGDEDNVQAIMRHPRHGGGSDGILIGARPHPRGRGTFPRYLGHYVRELGVLTLEEAVQHLAGNPAARLGLDRGDAPRGVIREGATADLVLFDPQTVAAGATFEDPHRAPEGIREVLVAGVPVLRDGELTGAVAGRALRMPPPPHRATVPRIAAHIDPGAPGFLWSPETPVDASPELAAAAARLAGAVRDDSAAGPRHTDTSAGSGPHAAVDSSAAGITSDGGGAPIRLLVDEALGAAATAAGRIGEEAFRVTVAAEGVEIRGGGPAGVFRGATVLRQLRDPDAAATASALLPAGVWEGAPAHAWRGMMLDVARHFRPVEDVKRLIDLLADHHLNVLHLHLSDDQGWRFEVPGYPRLTAVGARREATQRGHGPQATVEPGVHEGFYSTAELRELVRYADDRAVTLVPEVELPGHVQAALAAYPELGNLDVGEPAAGPWERFGVNPRTLAPTEASLAFGRAAIDALCDVFTSEWIGIGGDEVPVTEWAQSQAAASRMAELGLATAHDVQPWFTAHFVAHVRARGRTALAWDEVLEGEVPDGVRILAWRGPVAMQEALERGIPVVACPDLEAYLDYPQSESTEEPIRVGPPLSIERAYTLRVPDGAVGGQANVWSEHLPTRDRVDFAVFPRLAAVAERLWEGGEPRAFADFARRLPPHLRRLAAVGVRYRPLDGPTPEQRRPGVPGKPMTVAAREAIVAGLVERLVERSAARALDARK
ncbi:family 20 glycosylhydrolase [Microbacterium sp. p3-SID336]|uniref:family 20 glycosylhydrolase n=1 Tax=Microbacterium sp. p3-SID336 TaxID=2916212 RepID=UPI0021A636B8|nr:family 20 glycosylhydrolase [Microbacterium sp. p3-SID336]MCT1477984.1 family 20 glycosylhydrolase [Microbacterium sp. p3-SID336]